MTESPAQPPPQQAPEAVLEDPIGLVLTGIGAGAAAGAFAITTGVSALRILQGGTPASEGDATTVSVLTASVMLGPVVSAAVTLFATRRIPDLWRRSVAAAISVFCAFLLSGLSAPVDMIAGSAGLAAFSVILLVVAVLVTRRALVIASH